MTFAPYPHPSRADVALGCRPKLEVSKRGSGCRDPSVPQIKTHGKAPLFFQVPASVESPGRLGRELGLQRQPPPGSVETRSELAPGPQRGGDASPNNGYNRPLADPRPGLQSPGTKTSHSLESGTGARAWAGPGNSAGLPGFGGRRRLGRHLSACSAPAQGRDCYGWLRGRLACQARRAEHRALRPAHA